MKHPLIAAFEAQVDAENALKMQAYMKDCAIFYGIKSQPRRDIFKAWLAENKSLPFSDALDLVETWYAEPYRELHYSAIDLLSKYTKEWPEDMLPLIEQLVLTHSWWDSVDHLEGNIIGPYLAKFPHLKEPVSVRWSHSDNFWLQRLSITFQLHYKKKTDFELLKRNILTLTDSKEFFVRKAIGWALRTYGRVAPDEVRAFVAATPQMSNLSRREAMKHLEKEQQ